MLSSHLLGEVDALCHRVGVMDAGRLVLDSDLDALRAPTGHVLVRTPDPAAAVTALDGRVVDRDGTTLVVRHDDPPPSTRSSSPPASGWPSWCRNVGAWSRSCWSGRGAVRTGSTPRGVPGAPIVIGTDLQLLLHRRRVWLCWALLCALPALVAVLLAATGLAPPPDGAGRSCPPS